MYRSCVLMGIALSLAFAPGAADAAVIVVPSDQPTIRQGLEAASPGDTVLVAADTYTGALNRDLDFAGKAVTLRGESGALATIIDCEGVGRGFLFHSGEDTTSVVESFTIRNAVADTGAGAKCTLGSSPIFLYCRFLDNEVTGYGGAIYCASSSPVIRSCEFDGNSASGGAYPHGGAVACVQGSSPVIHGCDFTENSSGNVGGAVACGASSPAISGCAFTGNVSLYGGGAIFASNTTALTISDCQFADNTGSQGGAIYTQSCPPTVTRCSFEGNGQRTVALLYGSSGGHFSECIFVNNVSHLHCYDSADATVSNCTFVGPVLSTGGVTINEASPTFDNCIFAFSSGGPVAACETGTETPSFTRCVFFSNEGGDDLCGSVSDTLHRDPLFCNVTGHAFDLCADSVCAPGNNPWMQLIGAQGVGCPECGSAVESATWGSVKALFR
jgi:predicted outer membrane repeat protein